MKKKHIINILIIFAISILITFTFSIIFGGDNFDFHSFALNVLYGVIIGGSLSISGFIARVVIRNSDIQRHPLKTYVVLLIAIFLFISIDVFVINTLWYRYIHGNEFVDIFHNTGIILVSVITIFIGITIFFIILSNNYMVRLVDAEREIQKTKHEADRSKFETLKSQINPHFLFNSLNSLSSLIRIDVDKADEFTNKLSSIYRYILDHQDDELVTLHDEIKFIEEYASLQSIRFDDNFSIEIENICNYKDMLIIPLSLQLILENVFKHNIISEKKRIVISICVSDNYIVIKNNKNLIKDTGVSHNVGLNNIINRYRLICDMKCFIENTDDEFIVKLPLLL